MEVLRKSVVENLNKVGIKNIKEAISCYIHCLEQDNLPVPEEKFEVTVVVSYCLLAPRALTRSR